jgi:hypothetical protein
MMTEIQGRDPESWYICTPDGFEICSFSAGTFEDAYPVAVSLWDAIAVAGEGTAEYHCPGIVLCQGHRELFRINYTTHER